ncbi:putative uncharacterized protein DDB_G0282133 [Phymastichus coffea]|uniref:putative uncharacterized protein DDB_G0282133 n=1 Tax=Phymastichus coffea TaxID=108790 RepID=UPI00273C0A69|nr:putative uncharacterized protein DDB_G0282133 [Phymastichus coffea]
MSLLSITVKKAQYNGIQAQQLSTYVTLKLKNVKSTTVTVKGLNPCWEQDFLFEINDLNTGLLIEVWSKGMLWDRALGYHYMILPKVSYSNESFSEKWISLDSELEMKGNDVVGTKCSTGHILLIDCRFEIPFDLENIKASDLQCKLEILNNTIDQGAGMEQGQRQILYNTRHSGYSEDSDYTSDFNYPVAGQCPNSSASQFCPAANQLMKPQRSFEISRENSYEREDQQIPMNLNTHTVQENSIEYSQPDISLRYDENFTVNDIFQNNRVYIKSEPLEPLFYNSRPQYIQNEYTEYSINSWSNKDQTNQKAVEQNNSILSSIDDFYGTNTELSETRCPRRKPSLERQQTIYDEYLHYNDSNDDVTFNCINEKFPETHSNLDHIPKNSRYIQVDEDRQWDSGGTLYASYNIFHGNQQNKKSLPQRPTCNSCTTTICNCKKNTYSGSHTRQKELSDCMHEIINYTEYTAKKLPLTPTKFYDIVGVKNNEISSISGRQLPVLETHSQQNYCNNSIYVSYNYDENYENSLSKNYEDSNSYDDINFSPINVTIPVSTQPSLENTDNFNSVLEQNNLEHVADKTKIVVNNDIIENCTYVPYHVVDKLFYQNCSDNIDLNNTYSNSTSLFDTFETNQDNIIEGVTKKLYYENDNDIQYFDHDLSNQSYNNKQCSEMYFHESEYSEKDTYNKNRISSKSIYEQTHANMNFSEKLQIKHSLEDEEFKEHFSAEQLASTYFEEQFNEPASGKTFLENEEFYELLELNADRNTENVILTNKMYDEGSTNTNTHTYFLENYYNDQLMKEQNFVFAEPFLNSNKEIDHPRVIPSHNLKNSCFKSQDSIDTPFHDDISENNKFSEDIRSNDYESYEQKFSNIEKVHKKNSFKIQVTKQMDSTEQIRIDDLEFPNSDYKDLVMSTNETKLHIKNTNNKSFESTLKENESFNANIEENYIDSSEFENNDLLENVYGVENVSSNDTERRKLPEAYLTRTSNSSSPILIALSSFSKTHIQPVVSKANDMINRISTAAIKDSSAICTNMEDNSRLINDELNPVELMEDENFADSRPEKYKRKDSEHSHYSYQSRLSDNSMCNSELQKFHRENSCDYEYNFDDSRNKRDSYVQINRNDSFITDDNDQPLLIRSDSLRSTEHRRKSYGKNCSAPQPISRAESYQRGYFNDQEAVDRTEIILGSATNSEYIMFDDSLDRYENGEEAVIKKSRDDSLIDRIISDSPRNSIQKQTSLDESVQMDTPPRSPPEPPADEEILKLVQSPSISLKDRAKMTPKQKWHVAYNKIIIQLNNGSTSCGEVGSRVNGHIGEITFYSNIDSMPDIRPRRKSVPLVSELE